MTHPITIRRIAEREIDEAVRWYDNQRDGLGDELLDSLNQTLARLRAYPLAYAVAHRDIRRVMLKTFPFAVYFRMRGNSVIVIGFLRGNRKPSLWRRR